MQGREKGCKQAVPLITSSLQGMPQDEQGYHLRMKDSKRLARSETQSNGSGKHKDWDPLQAIQDASWPWGNAKREGEEHENDASHKSEDLETSSRAESNTHSIVPSVRGHQENPRPVSGQQSDEDVVRGEYLQSQ